MRKYAFAIITLFLSFSAFSQVKIGLKVSPNFSWNNVIHDNDSLSLSGNGLKIRGGAGVMIDLMLSDNFAVATGLSYMTKGSGIRFNSAGTEIRNKYSLQYLEIPVTIKVYTNEIMDYTRLYFQVGVSANTNIAAKINDENVFTDSNGETQNMTKNINFLETALLVGSGIEMEMGESTVLVAGLTYSRGLLNIDNTGLFDSPNKLTNNYVGIDLGLKF